MARRLYETYIRCMIQGMWSNEAITACAVGVACALILIAAAVVMKRLMTRKMRPSAFGNAVISLGSCSRHDLRPELNKAGVPIPLGKDKCGQASTSWPQFESSPMASTALEQEPVISIHPIAATHICLLRLSMLAQGKT